MKKLLFFTIILGFLMSCSNGDDKELEIKINLDSQLTGKWQLVEQLMDPGDGSGTFQPVTSDHTIELFKDETIKSSKQLCYAVDGENAGTTGTIDTDRSVLILEGCHQDESLPKMELSYNLQDSNLIVNLLCIEPCVLKFKKIK